MDAKLTDETLEQSEQGRRLMESIEAELLAPIRLTNAATHDLIELYKCLLLRGDRAARRMEQVARDHSGTSEKVSG